MTLPSCPSNYSQERIGISSVALSLARLKQIWRETPSADVGIDGQIEYVNRAGEATGQIIAAQVKSGPSYFHDHGEMWHFYPSEKHRLYWEICPIPVILFLHDPASDITYWCDARQYLKGENYKDRYIPIPKHQILSTTVAEQLFQTSGVSGDSFLNVQQVLEVMIKSRSTEGGFPLSYFELFVHGLVNICRSVYFHMDIVTQVVEYNLHEAKSEFGMGMGSDEYEFLYGYFNFLVAQQIADIDFSALLTNWEDRKMTPRFIAPLTSRGRELIELISCQEDDMKKTGVLADDGRGSRVVQESYIERILTDSSVRRFPLITEFERNYPRTPLPKESS